MNPPPITTRNTLLASLLGLITAIAILSYTSSSPLYARNKEKKKKKRRGHERFPSISSSSSSSFSSSSSSSPSPQHQLHNNDLSRNPESQNLLNLLYSIAEDQARKEGYIHRGITCNNCGTSPVRSTRYKCANCVDYDLCEGCEAQECHLKTHVFLKIRIPIPPLANPRAALLNVFYPGKEMDGGTLTFEKLRELQQQTHFDQVELEALYEQFRSLSTVETSLDGEGGGIVGGIDKDTFEKCLGPLGLEKNLITERIFHFFDQDGDGVIVFGELVCGLSVLCKGSLDEKMEYAFKGYDLDDDGYISRTELRMMFKAYFQLSMELVRDVVKAMEEEMLEGFEATDSAGMPVSAAFTAPIPAQSIENWEDREKEEHELIKTESHVDSPREEDEEGGGWNEKSEVDVAESSTVSSSSKNFMSDDAKEEMDPLYSSRIPSMSSSTSPRRESAPYGARGRNRRNFPADDHLQASSEQSGEESGGEESNRRRREEWPVMEAMSQDAIEEMVERTFAGIGSTEREGYISFEEFRQYVQTDASIVSWFESLGTVF